MSNFVMSLEEINEELERLAVSASLGDQVDEIRLDTLISMKMNNPEFQEQERLEHERWLEEWRDFLEQAVVEMRGYVPHTIFEISQSELEKSLSSDLVKRLFQKQCLWLVRLNKVDISRLHESMLFGRYNPEGHDLDVVELGAIYFSLPEAFSSDHPHYRKISWRERIQLRLKTALKGVDLESMDTFNKSRKSLYLSISPPFEDVESMHTPQITRNVVQRKKSFEEVCRRHSILRKSVTEELPIQEGDEHDNGRESAIRTTSVSYPSPVFISTASIATTNGRSQALVNTIEQRTEDNEQAPTRCIDDKKKKKGSSKKIRTADI